MQTTIGQNRQRRLERFEAYETQRRITDEITDMSERLAAPMRNTFEYEMRSDGELWFQGEPLGRIFDDGIKVAEELTLTDPRFATELVRRQLEREEYNAMRELALGSPDDPDLLVVLSPIPDAVLDGLELNAYDLERKKTLTRIFRRTETGIEATSLSLDLSDRDGLQAIADKFGKVIDPDASSEDILAMRFWGYDDKLGGKPYQTIRSLYDAELSRKFGGEWYAGRRSSLITDTKTFVEQQSDLVARHMQELEMLQAVHTGKELEDKLEAARYNLAAALARRMRGDSDAGSLSEAGEEARAKGERYDGDCPTGVKVTAEESKSQLYGEEKWMTCPFCGLATYGDPCASRLVCGKCSAEVRDGRIVSKGIGRERALGLRRSPMKAPNERAIRHKKAAKPTVHEIARRAFGESARVRHHVGIGIAYAVAYDSESGQDLGRL